MVKLHCIVIQDNIVFDFELVSNAKILEKIGKETENSKKVVEIWNGAQKDAATKDGEKRIVSWSGFTNVVLDAEVKGTHITFEDYLKDSSAEDYKNKPYNVKYVLEDGLYGEAQPFSKVNYKEEPEITVEKTKLGQDVEAIFKDEEWAKAIEYIKVGSTQLLDDEYEVKSGKLILKAKQFMKGTNSVTVVAKEYKDAKFDALVETSDIDLKISTDTNKVGQDINVVGVTSDYVNNIQSIMLNGKMLLSKEAVSSNWGYRTESNKIVLSKDLFEDTTQQTLIIKAYGYEKDMIQFILEKGDGVVAPEGDKLPTVVTELATVGDDVVIKLKGDTNQWRSAVSKVEIEGKLPLSTNKYSIDEGEITISASVFSKGTNKVVIEAEGYDHLTFTQNMVANHPEYEVKTKNTKDGIKISVPAQGYVWIEDINNIKLDGIKLESKDYKKETVAVEASNDPIEKPTTDKDDDDSKKTVPNISIKDDNGKGAENIDQGQDVTIVLGRTSDQDVKDYKEGIDAGDIEITGVSGEVKYKIEQEGKMMPVFHLVLSKDYFKEAGDYTIVLKGKGYEEESLDITVKGDEPKPNPTPTPDKGTEDVPVVKDGQSLGSNGYRINIKEKVANEWIKNVDEVLVNKEKIGNDAFRITKSMFDDSGAITFTNADDFADGKNDVVIKARGYGDCKFSVQK